MGRTKSIKQSVYPYAVTSRCMNREWFNLPMKRVWEIFSEELYMTVILHKMKIHSFVLMKNHFHMIISTPLENIDKCMHRFIGNTSRRLNEEGNRINENFAGRYYKSILESEFYYLNAYKYFYRNPIKAGLCKKVELYKYSSLSFLIGDSMALFPVEDHPYHFFEDRFTELTWLNQDVDCLIEESVKKALKKSFFRFGKTNIAGKKLIDKKTLI